MIALTPRLRCALSLLEGLDSVADIGCDHGRLSAALLQRGQAQRVIACDCSDASLKKAEALLSRLGLLEKASLRLGDGLTVLSPEECQGAAILGMGGELIAHLLEAAPQTASSFLRLALQPMQGGEELRRWLYENSYRVLSDRLVSEGRRIYQLLAVQKADKPDPWPEGFPVGCYLVGYKAFLDKEPLLPAYCQMLLSQRQKRLAEAKGTLGEEKLAKEAADLERILKEWSKANEA